MLELIIVKKGAVKIGRTGTKLHPAIIGKFSFQAEFKPYLMIQCSCGGTANGHARHKATFFENAQPNCGGTTLEYPEKVSA